MKNKDFTFTTYKHLLNEFRKANYSFLTLEQYCNSKELPKRFIILRHDVDRTPKNSLKTAKIENYLGLKASYYFRINKQSNQPKIIKQIAELGHEIGYHYEDLANANGDYQKAIKTFKNNLEYFRKFYSVKTICMHGSPLSKWDNKDLWQQYSYKEYNIIAEPYVDLNFNEIFYITDASRSWNNREVTIRDNVKTNFNINIDTVFDVIKRLKEDKLPYKIMLNAHPQNWTDNIIEWYKTIIWQNFKNFIKRHLKK